jgi:sortase B
MKLQKIIKTICLILVILGVAQTAIYIVKSINHKADQKRLAQLLAQSTYKEETTIEATPTPQTVEVETETQTEAEIETQTAPAMLEKFTSLYEENPDIVGWLTIEGTKIDYPVMQNEDDEYYLHRDFYGNEDKYGCLYVRNTADVFTPGTNVIIYGHNMKDGSMFGTLKKYQTEDYYKEHPTITFDTLYEERTYQIIAVFYSQVYNTDDDVFKYYQFYQADTKEEFDNFYTNIKALSLYDTGIDATYSDTFITLSTCSYQVEDGRFVVVAKKVD